MSITDSRVQILGLFYKQEGALAHADIEKRTSDKIDRVTIYRTLQTFEEKGLIHSIPTADNSVKYALCKEQCEEGHHHDNHVHFICDVCGKTICLDDVLVPEVKLPKGFQPHQSNMVVTGVCGDCK
jgi:Fur family ferric uptake transcriptional regulator